MQCESEVKRISSREAGALCYRLSEEEVQEKLLKFRINGLLSERNYCRGGNRIQILVRKSREVEGVLDSILSIRVPMKGIENIHP